METQTTFPAETEAEASTATVPAAEVEARLGATSAAGPSPGRLARSNTISTHNLPLDRWFETQLRRKAGLVLVFYRGGWSCQAYMQEVSNMVHELDQNDVAVYGVSSASQMTCDKEKAAWRLNCRILSDTDLLLTTHLRKQGMVDLTVTTGGNGLPIIHPGVLIVSKDRKVVYSWALVPGLMNLAGAIDRPQFPAIWQQALRRLHGEEPYEDDEDDEAAVPREGVCKCLTALLAPIFGRFGGEAARNPNKRFRFS